MRHLPRLNRTPISHGKRSKAASRCPRSGEWTRAGYRAPACYVTNARPIIRATFSAAPADLSSVTLLAETDAAIGGKVQLEALKFNWDHGHATNDSINLRADYDTPFDLTNGEWVRGGQNLPACYVTNVTPVLEARFTVVPDRVTSCTLFATGGPFGGIQATNVAFANGDSGFVRLSAAGTTGTLLTRLAYNLKWKASALNGDGFSDYRFQETQGHVFYSIFGEPLPPWKANPLDDNQNAWTNALEFAIAKTGAKGKASEAAALAAIVPYLHSGHGLVYDSYHAYPNFAQNEHGGKFELSSYLVKSIQLPTQQAAEKNTVVCFDKAGGVVSLGRLLGIGVQYRYMDKFGYIHASILTGGLECNNPFYPKSSSKTPMTGIDELHPIRTYFSCHAFATLGDAVFDACIGPVAGKTLGLYLNDTIDDSQPGEQLKSGKQSPVEVGAITEVY